MPVPSPKLAIIYYSATGSVDRMAHRVAETAQKSGADVRLLKVAETAPDDAIDANPQWRQHLEDTRETPTATPDDIDWAEVVLFGSPTRFGNMAAQLKEYLDQLGPLWSEGRLADKVYAGFTSTATEHGGQESTLLAIYNSVYHFGGVIVPPGYTAPSKFDDGNPYGVSHTSNNGEIAPAEREFTALDHLSQRVLGYGRVLAAHHAEVSAIPS
jgi:NAD(P)H dehydrogenase (quinone)